MRILSTLSGARPMARSNEESPVVVWGVSRKMNGSALCQGPVQ